MASIDDDIGDWGMTNAEAGWRRRTTHDEYDANRRRRDDVIVIFTSMLLIAKCVGFGGCATACVRVTATMNGDGDDEWVGDDDDVIDVFRI